MPDERRPRAAPLLALVALVAVITGCSVAPVPTSLTPAPAVSSATATVTTSPAATVRLPPVNGRFDYQIGGAYAPSSSVTIVTRDRSDAPVPGRYSICYVNAFQTQPEEAAFWTKRHPDLLLKRNGRYLIDPDWPGEYLLDTSTTAKRSAIAGIVDGWITGCARAGFAAVEPDNLDSFTRSKGLLTQADNVALARLLAHHAHLEGLAIGQKNTVELGSTGRTVVGFDFAVAEECQVYAECGDYTAVYGDRVIEIEYTDNARRFYTAACAAQGRRISVILRDRDVLPQGRPGYVYQAC